MPRLHASEHERAGSRLRPIPSSAVVAHHDGTAAQQRRREGQTAEVAEPTAAPALRGHHDIFDEEQSADARATWSPRARAATAAAAEPEEEEGDDLLAVAPIHLRRGVPSRAAVQPAAKAPQQHASLRVWLPRRVEALCTPADAGEHRGACDDAVLPTAMWRRTPARVAAAHASAASTSLLSPTRWCVTAYEPLTLSRATAVADCTAPRPPALSWATPATNDASDLLEAAAARQHVDTSNDEAAIPAAHRQSGPQRGVCSDAPTKLSATPQMRHASMAPPGRCAGTHPPSTEWRIQLPWLLRVSSLPPAAAGALARCLTTHAEALVQRHISGSVLSSTTSTTAVVAAAVASPPPCWVAAFAYTEVMLMTVTERASCLAHAHDDDDHATFDAEALMTTRACGAGARPHRRCSRIPSTAAPIDALPWPHWVPDAETSVHLLAAITSGAFLLVDMIANALDVATSSVQDRCEDTTTTAAAAVSTIRRLRVFCSRVFGDAANKRLCRHVCGRLPMHVRDLHELVARPWCGEDAGDDVRGAWRARCPSMLDLVHHLAHEWMAESFAALADRLHTFLVEHDPGVVLDQLRGANDVAGECAATAAATATPDAHVFGCISDFAHGPLQRWERWRLASAGPGASRASVWHTAAGRHASATPSAAAVQWATHVHYSSVRSFQWVLQPPRAAAAAAMEVASAAALVDMHALLQLLTLLPSLVDTQALMAHEAVAVLRRACAAVVDSSATNHSHAAQTAARHAFTRVFLGVLCFGATQMSDAEAAALLACVPPPPSSSTAGESSSAGSSPDLRAAQAVVESLWVAHVLPLAVGYASVAGAAPVHAEALAAAEALLAHALRLLDVLQRECRRTDVHAARAAPSPAQHDPSRPRHKRARSSAVESPSQRRRWWRGASPAACSVSSSALTAVTAPLYVDDSCSSNGGNGGEAPAATAHAPPVADWREACQSLIQSWRRPAASPLLSAADVAVARTSHAGGELEGGRHVDAGGGGHTLHRRDIRRVRGVLAGLARRVAAAREDRDVHTAGPCAALSPELLVHVARVCSGDDTDDESDEAAAAATHSSRASPRSPACPLRCSASTATSASSDGDSAGDGHASFPTTAAV
ncbi:PTP1-interacting protein, 39 kDa [Novymonas esmeraldas]|uniref:PTP1-interacting protein, 39 kDa n=1 Tax=Novymonas esmeraldas TaxID=1808958 RepID=A0AAW0ENW1_9TRYP